MPEQHHEASKLDKSEEVFDVVFPSSDEAAEGVHPGKEPLHFPAPAIAAQFASVLALAAPVPVRRDQLDAVVLSKRFVEFVRVVGFVADEPGWEFIEKASGKNLFHKSTLGW